MKEPKYRIPLPTALENRVRSIKGLDVNLLEDCLTITFLIYINQPHYLSVEDLRQLSGIDLSRIKELLSVLLRIELIKVVNVENKIAAATINKAQLDREQLKLDRRFRCFNYCRFLNEEHLNMKKYLTLGFMVATLSVAVLLVVLFCR